MRKIAIALSLTVGLVGQTPKASPPNFEVASLHLNTDFLPNKVVETSTSVAYDHVPMGWVVARAYNVLPRQVVGPGWLRQTPYSLQAKLPEAGGIEDIPVMLRTLLAERMGLRVHEETRIIESYVLTVANAGVALPRVTQAGKTKRSVILSSQRALIQGELTIKEVAQLLTPMLDKPMVDATGLPGSFQVKFDASLGNPVDAPAASAPSIFTVLKESGLKVEVRNVPVQVIVVDAATQEPTAN
jgi:uncharacterized protein (TIGR03435 family)